MKTALKKQLDSMTDDEIKSILRRDYLRRLTRYRMSDNFYRKKYNMDFDSFEKANIVKKRITALKLNLMHKNGKWQLME